MPAPPYGNGYSDRWARMNEKASGDLRAATLASSAWPARLIAAAAVLLAFPLGFLLAVAGLQAMVALMMIALFILTLMLPWRWLLLTMLLVVFVVVGPLQYIGGWAKAFWIPYLLGLLLLVRTVAQWTATEATTPRTELTHSATVNRRTPWAQWTPWTQLAKWSLWGFALVALLSSAMSRIEPLQWLVGAKEYLFLSSIALAFHVGGLKLSDLKLLPQGLTAWLVLQLPFVAWQRFWIAPRRAGESPWDAVVGLFAGSAFTGGDSGAMAMVSLVAATAVILAWQDLRCPPWMALLALVSAGLACAGAEVKFAVLLLPLLGMWVAIRPTGLHDHTGKASLLGRWPRWLGVISVGVLLSALLAWTYQLEYTSARSLEGQSMKAYADTVMARNLDDNTLADAYGQMTRMGALRFWLQRQEIQDVPSWLVGHGMGSSRRGNWVIGEMARLYPFDIGRSSLAILLWEVGVLGCAALLTSMSALILAAWQMQSAPALQPWRWLLHSAAAMLGVALMSLPYGPDLLVAPQLATATLLMMGVVFAADRLQAQSS